MNSVNSVLEGYRATMQTALAQMPLAGIEQLVTVLYEAWVAGRTVFVLGNGGSAATASHMACDLSKQTRINGQQGLRVLALNDNMSIFSAYANDEGYHTVFANQLATFMEAGDIVIGISASGNSPNVLAAIELANAQEVLTVGICGFDGGQLAGVCQLPIHIVNDCIEQVEDIHLIVSHMVTVALRTQMEATTAVVS